MGISNKINEPQVNKHCILSHMETFINDVKMERDDLREKKWTSKRKKEDLRNLWG